MQRLEIFNQYRSLLFAIAYRMLSSTADAEDMMQEAWIRWQSTQTIVQSPKAFLSSLITRLCIDQLRSARMQREKYVGIWLPEPLITETMNPSADHAELAESLSFAFLTLLECLSPTERAVFCCVKYLTMSTQRLQKPLVRASPIVAKLFVVRINILFCVDPASVHLLTSRRRLSKNFWRVGIKAICINCLRSWQRISPSGQMAVGK